MMAIPSTQTSHSIHQQVNPPVNNDGSQCDTICDEEDEEMTEEEEREDEERDDDDEDLEGEEEEEGNENITEEGSSTCTEESSDGANEEVSLSNLSPEIQLFANQFPDFCKQFQVLSKIGEGTFSSVYKAVDLNYHLYDNSWDENWKDFRKWASPPMKRRDNEARRPPKYVALKRIYVTSSPTRILNELALLHHLKGCDKVVSLITAFRNEDQIIAVLPYFRHVDFRDFYRTLSIREIRLYFLSLFSALDHVHSRNIIHRDIKPSNFLFDISTRQGVLVDFGLAERKNPLDPERCPCSLTMPEGRQDRITQVQKLTRATPLDEGQGYLKHDQRPAKRANRAGTRGFRAPEVLFRCQSQTTKIDIWSCGVILLSFLSKRFPFFNSTDDVDAMIELTSIFGKLNMKMCAKLHNCTFDATLPTLSDKPMSFLKIVQWARSDMQSPDREHTLAFEFLNLCMELDPKKRVSAADALQHPFLSSAEEDQYLDDDVFLS